MQKVDPLLDCLLEIARIYGRPTTASALVSGLPVSKDGLSPSLFHRAASRAGLASRVVKIAIDEINTSLTPAVLILNNNRACVLLSIGDDKKTVKLLYPESGQGEVEVSFVSLFPKFMCKHRKYATFNNIVSFSCLSIFTFCFFSKIIFYSSI